LAWNLNSWKVANLMMMCIASPAITPGRQQEEGVGGGVTVRSNATGKDAVSYANKVGHGRRLGGEGG
jgi:hypothetical protein